MDGRRRRQVLERFDLTVGLLGFFTVAFCAVTLAAELQGEQALGWALVTLAFGAGTWGVWRWRRAALSRPDADVEPD